jgi:hypothetical protein
MDATTFHTCAELAQRWRVGEESIRRYCRLGKVPYTQIGGKKLIPDWAVEQMEQMEKAGIFRPRVTHNTKD